MKLYQRMKIFLQKLEKPAVGVAPTIPSQANDLPSTTLTASTGENIKESNKTSSDIAFTSKRPLENLCAIQVIILAKTGRC